MREITTISLTYHELREAITSYIFAKTGRELPKDVSYTVENEPQLPAADCTQAVPLPFARVTCSASDLDEVLKQGQWVNVRDPADSLRNPFQVRFGEEKDGIINYKLADSLMDPASRTYTRDELELVDLDIMKIDPNPHVVKKSNFPTDEELTKMWESHFTNAIGKPVKIRGREIIVDETVVDDAWENQSMNEIMLWDREGRTISEMIKSIIDRYREIEERARC